MIIFLCLFLFAGCSSTVNRQLEEEKYNAYLTYYQSILETDDKDSSSPYFDIEVIVNKVDENYRYDIVIDNPRIAMFQVKALAIIDGLTIEVDTENMMPSIGIIDDIEVNLVPGQIDKDRNYQAGIDLTLYSEYSNLNISVMVDWLDLSGFEGHRDYVSLYAQYSDAIVEDSASQ